MSQPTLVTEDDLYELLSFLITSAHLCVNEPRHYGTFRLVDAACRLMGFAFESGQLKDDQFLRDFKAGADTGKFLLFSDEEQYFQFLEDATRTLAREMKHRVAAGESDA